MFKKDSLKKTLLMNYPGCKSAVDAFELAKSQLSERPSETTQEYKSMRQAIIDIEISINGFDIDCCCVALDWENSIRELGTL